MSRRTRRKGADVRGKRLTSRQPPSGDDSYRNIDDTLERVRRLATDTAELLIVHEPCVDEAPEHDAPNERVVEALRHRLDSGDYAVLPDAVAEAMVRRAKALGDEES